MAKSPRKAIEKQSAPQTGLTARCNDLLLGHEHAEMMLREAFLKKQLAHAWLICGPRGIGKATLAYRFARFILAQGHSDQISHAAKNKASESLFEHEPPSPQENKMPSLYIPSDHSVFRRVAAGGHADLLTIERGLHEKTGRLKSEITVDDCRAIGHFSRLTAAENGWRVIIIDSVDEMNRNAANALLKTLEEPPRNTVLLLVCHAAGRLLDTIRSRCRKLTLNPLASDHCHLLLAKALPDYSEQERAALVSLSRGSPGEAIALAEAGGLDLKKEIDYLLSTLPTLDISRLYGLAETFQKAGAERDFTIASDLLLQWLEQAIKNAALVRSGVAMPMQSEDFSQNNAQAQGFIDQACLEDWMICRDHLKETFRRCDRLHLEKKQSFIEAFLRIKALLQGRPQPA